MLWFVVTIALLLITSLWLKKLYLPEHKYRFRGLRSLLWTVLWCSFIMLLFCSLGLLVERGDQNVISRYTTLVEKYNDACMNEYITETERVNVVSECSQFNQEIRSYHARKNSLWVGIFEVPDLEKCDLFVIKNIKSVKHQSRYLITPNQGNEK